MSKVGSGFQAIGRFLWKIKWLLLLIAAGAVGFLYFRSRQAEQAIAEQIAREENRETATVERRDLMTTITATGIIESNEKRTISAVINNTKVQSINCEVGDLVAEGDVLVTFTTDSIDRSISQVREDITESEAKKSIDTAANERNYYYSYGVESITLRDLQIKIDRAQKDLNEACDGYGSTKREKQEYIDAGHPTEEAELLYDDLIASYYMKIETCQNNLADAKRALEDEIYKGSHTLATQTDTYNTGNLTADDNTKSLRRQLDSYMDSLDDYQVESPITGVVTEINVQEGNGFGGGNILTVQNCDVLYIKTEIDEYDIPDIKVGQRVIFKTDATRDEELEGLIDTIAPTSTAAASGTSTTGVTTTAASSASNGVTYAVKVRILTKEEKLKLGMSAKLSIITEEKKDALTVPYDAIIENENGDKVITVLSQEKPQIRLEVEKPQKWYEKVASIFQSPKTKEELMPAGPTETEIPVQVGLESDYYTEISGKDVAEGSTVLIPEPEDDFSGGFFDFGPGGP